MAPGAWGSWMLAVNPCEFWNTHFAKCTNDFWFSKETPVHFTLVFVWPPYLDSRWDNMHTKDIHQYMHIELLPI